MNKLTSRRIVDHFGFESISDIHLLFNNLQVEEMDDYFSPLDFSAINGYPQAIPEKPLDKLSYFQGNNAISAKIHIRAFTHCVHKWCGNVSNEYVKMKLFVLSLEEDALDWFSDFVDNKFKIIKELIGAFIEKWGDKKEHRHLLAALNTIKKNENETMEEFNKRLNELINSLHKDIKPPNASILIC